jgi:hypothetical protein
MLDPYVEKGPRQTRLTSCTVQNGTGFNSCTTPIQQLYNNPLHEGGPQYVGPTIMWEIVVQLLYWCYKSNIFQTAQQHRAISYFNPNTQMLGSTV